MNNAKIWFWVLLDVLIAAAVINVIFFVMPMLGSLKGSFAAARTITVSAQGKTTATPDLAEISLSVVSRGQNPATLSDANNSKMNAVLVFVKSQGIAPSDMATTAYDLQPNYQYDQNTGRNFITGYTLTQTISVKVRVLDNVATVLAGLAPLGVNQIGGVNFTFDNPDKFIAIARADALKKAQAEAGEMAAQAGASLGAVINVGESQYVPMPFYDKAMAGGMGASAPVVPTIQPGTQDVTDQVTVTYELR